MAHRGLATGQGRYIDFLAPGILAQSVLFSELSARDGSVPIHAAISWATAQRAD